MKTMNSFDFSSLKVPSEKVDFVLEPVSNEKLIQKLGSKLAALGYRQAAIDVHKAAKAYGYEFRIVLKLLKMYTNV